MDGAAHGVIPIDRKRARILPPDAEFIRTRPNSALPRPRPLYELDKRGEWPRITGVAEFDHSN
jgi:hypothetical protein